jgi:ribulose-5-phosphate 4-epimerase/fuculose-1-phosphate aldolase
MPVIDQDLKRRLAESAAEMVDQSLTTGLDAGDISVYVRDEGLIYALPRPCERLRIRSWKDIRPEDVAVIDPAGEVVEGSNTDPTVEIPMHLRIYEARPDISAVVHSHGEWSQVFATTGRDIPTSTIDTFVHCGFGPIRWGRFGLVGSEELAVNMVEALGKTGMAALMACHGAVSLGADLDEAMQVAKTVERAARQALFAYQIGEPQQLTLAHVIADEELAARVASGEVRLHTQTLQVLA